MNNLINSIRYNYLFEYIPGEKFRREFIIKKANRIKRMIENDEWRELMLNRRKFNELMN